ncbi:MAG: O-antigen ligase family protein [Acidimicrobiales bacterium]
MMAILQLLALVVAAGVALFLVDVLIRRPVAVAWLVLMLVVLEALIDSTEISVFISGFRISPSDVGFALIAGAATFRLIKVERRTSAQVLLVVLGSVGVANLVRGMGGGAIEVPFPGFRTYLAFVSPALYFSTVTLDIETRRGIANAWFWAGAAMAAVVVTRWVGRVSGTDLGIFDATYDAAIRVLSGPQTMFVASGAVVLLLGGIDTSGSAARRERQMGAVLMVMAIILNRRTAWLALAVALAILLFRNRSAGRRMAKVIAASVVILAASLGFILNSAGELSSAAQGVTDSGTLSWRVEGWAELLQTQPQGPVDYLFGLPFGNGYARTIDGVTVTVSPHNFFIQTFLRSGIIGLGALMAVLWISMKAALSGPPDERGQLSDNHLVILLAMLVVWLLTWTPGAEQGLILGLAAGIASLSKPSPDDRSLQGAKSGEVE